MSKDVMMDAPLSRGKQVFLALFAFASFCSFIYLLFWESDVRSIGGEYVQRMQTAHTIWVLPASLLMLYIIHRVVSWLETFEQSWLEWSPGHIGVNISVYPVTLRYVGLVYAPLLLLVMPFFAYWEELIFRKSIDYWPLSLVVSTVVFGVLHYVMCITTRVVIVLSVFGFMLWVAYMATGIWGATQLHATYNIMVVGYLIYAIHLKPQIVRAMATQNFRRHLPTVTVALERTKAFAAPAQ